MPALKPKAVAFLDRLLGPVDREGRGDEDRRVHAGDFDGQFGAGSRPRVALGDADEEVGREEGAEDHHLGDDEKEHPEQRRVHARAGVGGWRAVVVVRVVVRAGAGVREAGGLHRLGGRSRGRVCLEVDDDVLDGAPRSCAGRARSGSRASSPSAGLAASR